MSFVVFFVFITRTLSCLYEQLLLSLSLLFPFVISDVGECVSGLSEWSEWRECEV